MIKVGDRVEILDDNSSDLSVGSQHIVTAFTGVKERNRRVVEIDGWLFPTDYLKKVKEEER